MVIKKVFIEKLEHVVKVLKHSTLDGGNNKTCHTDRTITLATNCEGKHELKKTN